MVNARPDQFETYPLGLSAVQVNEPPSTQGLQLLYDVVQTLAGARSLRDGLRNIIERIARVDGWDLGIAWLNTPTGLKFQDAWNKSQLNADTFLETMRRWQQKKPAECLSSMAANQHALVFIPMLEADTGHECNRHARDIGLVSALGLPLMVGNTLYGVIELFSRTSRECLPDTLGLFRALSADIAGFIEARQLEQQLHDNNAKLAEAHRIARMAYWEMNLQTLQLHGNEDTAMVLGLTPDRQLRDLHDLYALVLPEDHPKLQAMIAGAQQLEHPIVNIEHRVRNADGTDRHILVQAQGRFDINGKPVRITGTIQDITEQKRAAARALQSEHRWEIAFRNSPVASLITELESGLCLDANDEMLRCLGKPSEDVIGKTTTELQLWPPGRSRQTLIDQVKENGRVRDFELTTHLAGKEAHLLINLEIIDFADRVCLLGQWINVTRQKQLEERLRLAAAALEYAGDALVLMDQRGNIISINPAFTQVTGYTEEQALGEWFFGLVHKASGRHDKSFFRQAVNSVESEGTWKGEAWGRRADGVVIPTFLTLSAIRHPTSNNVTHYVGVFSDISRQKEYEARLQQMAWYDDLTGVANRSLLIERGNRALLNAERHDTVVALLFVDLDRFKAVNDTYGHAAGDELLRQVAERLCICVRASDTLARLGGDEFIVLLPEVTEENGANVVADKIQRALSDPFLIDGHHVGIGASIGIAHYPQDGLDMPTLLQQADEGLYRVKRALRVDPDVT
ncbi:MAG: diguanylate cyclase [Alcaligenaceae bacterium]|nr:diguanylate cyclase [Alcaligenaceae bacterium]